MASKDRQPVGGRQAYSFVYNDQFYVRQDDRLIREHFLDGVYTKNQLLPLQRYDFSSAQWSGVSPAGVAYDFRYQTEFSGEYGTCCAVLNNCAYTFGGLMWADSDENAVHELNLETMAWRTLQPKNTEDGPMQKKNAGMVTCRDEALCVFGGYGPYPSRLQPGATYQSHSHHYMNPSCFTNELHLFHIGTGTWSFPETTGPRPPPCAGFSFTKVDLSRVVLFGGEQKLQRVNEVHILDMDHWHWSGTILPSSPADLWPRGRAYHSACALFDPTQSYTSEGLFKEVPHSSSSDMSTGQHRPQLFVLWGAGKKLRADAWILDVNTTAWKTVVVPPVVGQPRTCFSLGCHYRSPTEAELVVFGGVHHSHSIEVLSNTRSVGGTTLFLIGVKTLYHSCVDYVAERYELYQPLLQQLLPPHIQTDICRERDKRAHYQVAQL